MNLQLATELISPDVPVVVYGDEPHQSYNRVQLSKLLAVDYMVRMAAGE
ncbi:hypothetical protein [Parahaliea maris]|nr:hypothetical protein [Parahaliea maris]